MYEEYAFAGEAMADVPASAAGLSGTAGVAAAVDCETAGCGIDGPDVAVVAARAGDEEATAPPVRSQGFGGEPIVVVVVVVV